MRFIGVLGILALLGLAWALSYHKRDVKLRIYNQLGQTVRTLVDNRMKAGSYALEWDGADHMGRHVASGVYFYNLEAGDFTQIRKMTLVK